MVSFLMVMAMAVTTLYMGVYVADVFERMEMRRCPQASSVIYPDREE